MSVRFGWILVVLCSASLTACNNYFLKAPPALNAGLDYFRVRAARTASVTTSTPICKVDAQFAADASSASCAQPDSISLYATKRPEPLTVHAVGIVALALGQNRTTPSLVEWRWTPAKATSKLKDLHPNDLVFVEGIRMASFPLAPSGLQYLALKNWSADASMDAVIGHPHITYARDVSIDQADLSRTSLCRDLDAPGDAQSAFRLAASGHSNDQGGDDARRALALQYSAAGDKPGDYVAFGSLWTDSGFADVLSVNDRSHNLYLDSHSAVRMRMSLVAETAISVGAREQVQIPICTSVEELPALLGHSVEQVKSIRRSCSFLHHGINLQSARDATSKPASVICPSDDATFTLTFGAKSVASKGHVQLEPAARQVLLFAPGDVVQRARK